MALIRLDPRSATYDRLGGSVTVRAGAYTVEIAHDALEWMARRPLDQAGALRVVERAHSELSRLAMRIPADDDRIHVTRGRAETAGLHVAPDARPSGRQHGDA